MSRRKLDLSEKDIAQMREARASGKTYGEIAEDFGVSQQTVQRRLAEYEVVREIIHDVNAENRFLGKGNSIGYQAKETSTETSTEETPEQVTEEVTNVEISTETEDCASVEQVNEQVKLVLRQTFWDVVTAVKVGGPVHVIDLAAGVIMDADQLTVSEIIQYVDEPMTIFVEEVPERENPESQS